MDNPNKPTFKDVGWIFLATLVLMIAVSLFIADTPGKWNLVLLETVTILPALIFLYLKNWSLQETFRLKTISPAMMVASLVIGVGLSAVIDEFDRLVQMILPMNMEIFESLMESVQFHSFGEFVPLVIAAVFLAAIVEEMLFRGLLLRTLEQHMDVTNAVLISALIFAVIHINPWWAVQILVLGVLLGYMSWRSKSIIPGMMVHGVNNAISLAFINTKQENLSWYLMGDHVAPIWVFVGLAVTVGGFRLFYLWTQEA